MSAINLDFSTILSRREGIVSSSSGLQRIWPIYDRFNPAFAPLFKSKLLILKFLRQIGLNLKVSSSFLISLMISIDSMKCKDFLENRYSACLHESQAKSKEHTFKLSGMQRPWSIGISVLTILFEFFRGFVVTRILHSFLSRFKSLRSRIAILWTSFLWNLSREKFSIGPRLSQNC